MGEYSDHHRHIKMIAALNGCGACMHFNSIYYSIGSDGGDGTEFGSVVEAAGREEREREEQARPKS